MAGAGELRKRWEAVSARAIAAEMTFNGNCLVLGAQTRLAKVEAPVDEARLRALLAAAHGRSAPASSLRHARRAVETWRDGEKPLALTHLALSGLAKLAQSKEDARRLFFADALIEAGVAPSNIVEGLGLGPMPASEALAKYNADQPRVPAGNTDGGQWTRGDGAETEDGSRPGRSAGVEADALTTRVRAVVPDITRQAAAVRRGRRYSIRAEHLTDMPSLHCRKSSGPYIKGLSRAILQASVQEVVAAAKAGDPAAKRACKLLFNNRWVK